MHATFAESLQQKASAGRVKDVRTVVQRIQKLCVVAAEACCTSLSESVPNPCASQWRNILDDAGMSNQESEVELFEHDVTDALVEFGLSDISVHVSTKRDVIEVECHWSGVPSPEDAEFALQLSSAVHMQRRLNAAARDRICAAAVADFQAECVKQANLGLSAARSATDFSTDIPRDLAKRENPLGLGRRAIVSPLGSANDWTFAMFTDGATDGRVEVKKMITERLRALGSLDNLRVEFASEARPLHLRCAPSATRCQSVGIYKGFDVAPGIYPCSRYTACGTKCRICEAQFQFDAQLSHQAIAISYHTSGKSAPRRRTSSIAEVDTKKPTEDTSYFTSSSSPNTASASIRDTAKSLEVRRGYTKYRGTTHKLADLQFLRQLRHGGAYSSKDGSPDPDEKKTLSGYASPSTLDYRVATKSSGQIASVLKGSKARVARRLALEDVMTAEAAGRRRLSVTPKEAEVMVRVDANA